MFLSYFYPQLYCEELDSGSNSFSACFDFEEWESDEKFMRNQMCIQKKCPTGSFPH